MKQIKYNYSGMYSFMNKISQKELVDVIKTIINNRNCIITLNNVIDFGVAQAIESIKDDRVVIKRQVDLYTDEHNITYCKLLDKSDSVSLYDLSKTQLIILYEALSANEYEITN